MKRQLVRALTILLVACVMTVPAAHAVLQQAGPVNNAPSVGGFPAWYQDTTGLALEFCDPKNQAEVDGGWCLLLPGDPPAIPEVFPGLFFDEHFWFAADASIAPPGNPGLRVLLVLATEAAFFGGVAAPGDQIAFNRIRVRLDPVPATGLYRFIHPYGEELLEGTEGERIFFSDDVGVTPGVFTGLLTSRLGPFLLPSATPGGTEDAPVTGPAPGKLYIADPGRLGAVTGSPLPLFAACPNSNPCGGGTPTNHNIFRVEGPPGSNLGGAGIDAIQTTDFSLMGRIFQGAIAGRVNVDRANYEQPNGGPNKVDVFATAFPSTQGRIPPNPTPAVTIPNLVYYDGPCFDPVTGAPAVAGLVSTQMLRTGNRHWGQSAPVVIPQNPAEVCVVQTNALDAGGLETSAFFPAPLGDKVNITEALFTPGSSSLSVRATSMDVVGAPLLHVLASGQDLGDINPATGQLLLSPLTAPPDKVTVHSSHGGSNEMQVSTGAGVTGPAVGIPAAANDAVTIAEDSGTTTIAVLTNDTLDGLPIPPGPPIPTVAIVDAPLLGNAVVVAGVPVTGPLARINYTPNLNATGTDTFTYQVTVGGVDSNVATVTVTITPVNDGAPTANNDSATVNLNVATPINVLANDTDPDGQADIVAVANLTQPAAGASVALNGTLVNFTATVAGTYTFTYQAQDAFAAPLSNVATVTVTAIAPETLTINKAEYAASTRRYRVEGSIIPFVGQTITIQVLNGPTVLRTDTVVPRAGGAWVIQPTGVNLPNVPLTVRATSSNGTVTTRALVRLP